MASNSNRSQPCIAISCAPYRIQNPSDPQNTPQNTPRILSRNQNTKKLRKIYENPRFLYIFRNFFVFWFRERIRGVFWGVFWGSEGFCILYGAQEIANPVILGTSVASGCQCLLHGHFPPITVHISQSTPFGRFFMGLVQMGSEWFSPFFTRFSPFLFAFFPFFFAFFSASPKGQGQTTVIYCKNGEFHSDPVCTDPVQNFPTLPVEKSR